MTLRYVFILLFILLFSPCIQAEQSWIIATQNESIATGQTFYIEVIKPEQLQSWPDQLQLSLSATGANEVVTLARTQANTATTRQTYRGISIVRLLGVIRAQLLDDASNRILLLAASADDIAPLEIAVNKSSAVTNAPADAGKPLVILARSEDEPPLSVNEPMYFVLGIDSKRNVDSRFQLSFKYRPFDPGARVAQYFPALSDLYFGYTQTTLWDVDADSSTFKDTSYRPSLYYKWLDSGRNIPAAEWHLGVEHESNGQDGVDSRSINIAFVRPSWHLDLANGRRLTLSPKFYHYLEKSDNSDIHRYRGYVDWQARYGREDGAILSALYRHGSGGYLSG
jgi:hypothetical protein